MKTIYQQHEAAFSHISAGLILRNGEAVAKYAFKFPRDGAGRLWCYLHVIGLPMVRAYASGYGYDKKSVAFREAAEKQANVNLESWQSEGHCKTEREDAAAILAALQAEGDGQDWDRALRIHDFIVVTAV